MSCYLSASWIYPVSSPPLKNGVIEISSDGLITGIFTAEEAKDAELQNVELYEGILIPGLINTHCHLELSHLEGKIPVHTGLPGFVQKVISQRASQEEEIISSMQQADAAMYNNGIVAVGDISNTVISREVKLNSKLYYHTFVEAMGFNPEKAKDIIEKAGLVKKSFEPLKATIVPHAPYSVSAELFAEINTVSGLKDEVISIHNQETADENAFFETKTGHFLKLYEFLGLDISFFKAMDKTSIQTYLPLLSAQPNTLLVHNTFTSASDLEFASSSHKNIFWCLCPNANLYIEDRLPDVQLLRDARVKITLGTDSLASNHQLSILSEMQVLQDNKAVPFTDLLQWATLNGAEFLGIAASYGSLEVGKKPGINLITLMDDEKINSLTMIERLF